MSINGASRVESPLLSKAVFKKQFQFCLEYCEQSPEGFEMAYGKLSSFSAKVMGMIQARENFKEIERKNNLFREQKVKAKIDLVTERKAKETAEKLERKILPLVDKFFSQNYDLYLNSSSTLLPLVLLGDSSLRNRELELNNFGVLSCGETAAPKKVISTVPTLTHGSILNDGKWSILKNDVFILGVIHGHKTAYVASLGYEARDELLEEVFWDQGADRPALPGREITMLYHAGYRQVATEEQAAEYGYTFVCLDSERASNVCLMDLISAAEKIKDLSQIAAMFEPNLES